MRKDIGSTEIRQKKVEETIERPLSYLDKVGEFAAIGSWEVNLKDNHASWSPATAIIHEVEADYRPTIDEAINFYPPATRPVVTNAVERAIDQGIPYDLVVPFVTAKNNHLWVRIVGKPEIENGTCNRLYGIIQDVSEHKEAEEALLEAKLQLEASIEGGRIGLWDWDTTTNEVEFSAEWKRQLGYEDHEIRDAFDEWQNRVHPDDVQGALDRINTVLTAKSGDYREEFRMRHKDGSYRWILAQASVTRGLDHKPIRLLGSHTDITDLREAEMERERLSQEIQQIQKMESVGRLAGGIAHDFNNKLSVIMGYAQIAMDEIEKDNPLFPLLEHIYQAGESSSDLTRQLLAFARAQTVSPKLVNLNDQIANMLKMLGRLIGEDIKLVWEPSENLWLTKIDPGQFDQIMANLVVNARDAIGDIGTVSIQTSNANLDENYFREMHDGKPGKYVVISVTDTGSGISEELIQNIFEPFFTTKEVGKGTGLGLATVYGITQQNNGFVRVASKENEGSKFSVYLPFVEGDMAQNDGSEKQDEIPIGTETILVVEDEKVVLKLTESILKNAGYTVLAANTAEIALQLAEDHSKEIDMLITDVVMPDMNGRNLQAKISEILPLIPSLFVSGYTADIIAERGVLEEDVNFLQKPFRASQLCQKVREILGSKK